MLRSGVQVAQLGGLGEMGPAGVISGAAGELVALALQVAKQSELAGKTVVFLL